MRYADGRTDAGRIKLRGSELDVGLHRELHSLPVSQLNRVELGVSEPLIPKGFDKRRLAPPGWPPNSRTLPQSAPRDLTTEERALGHSFHRATGEPTSRRRLISGPFAQPVKHKQNTGQKHRFRSKNTPGTDA